jgi:hypothetical protein
LKPGLCILASDMKAPKSTRFLKADSVRRNRMYYRNRLRLILTHLDLRDATVLDVGCGEMLLHELAGHEMRSYSGIDQLEWNTGVSYQRKGLLEEDLELEPSYDFVVILGVMDHLSYGKEIQVLDKYRCRFERAFVINQQNDKSWLNRLMGSRENLLDFIECFPGCEIRQLDLLKFPKWSRIFNLSGLPAWLRKWKTETVYIISKGPG